MHARVALASNALSTTGLPLPAANSIHAVLADHLNAHGRLVFGADLEIQALLQTVKSGGGIPQDARTRWIETLVHLRKHGRISVLRTGTTPIADTRALDDLRAEWGQFVDVAIVADNACEPLGISAEVGIETSPETPPDVAITSAAANSPVMRRLKALADDGVASHGSSRDTFWDQVLKPLATNARSATVLDAYLFERLWEWNREGQRPRPSEHVAWLLSCLDAVMAPGSAVRLIGNSRRDRRNPDASDTAKAVRAHWAPTPSGRLSRVTVSLAETRGSERFPHDRHVRFSTGCAVKFESGLDRLQATKIADPDGMAWKYLWQANALHVLQSAEDRAASYSDPADVDVLDR